MYQVKLLETFEKSPQNAHFWPGRGHFGSSSPKGMQLQMHKHCILLVIHLYWIGYIQCFVWYPSLVDFRQFPSFESFFRPFCGQNLGKNG